jgi:hypothetical protein
VRDGDSDGGQSTALLTEGIGGITQQQQLQVQAQENEASSNALSSFSARLRA